MNPQRAAAGGPAAFSPAFGALMVAAAARPGGPWALAALAVAAVAVPAGVFDRRAATVAVVATVAAIGLGDPAPVFVAVSGLSAAAYLMTRYAGGAVTLTVPAAAGMLGFAVAGLAVAVIPVRLAWAPLIAPAVVAAILIVVVAPLVAEAVSGPAADRQPPG